MDSTLVAHVADALQRLGENVGDRDTQAYFAASLLDTTESLVTAARMYAGNDMNDSDFDEQVRIAIDTHYNDDTDDGDKLTINDIF